MTCRLAIPAVVALLLFAFALRAAEPPLDPRPRVVIETDAGGDPDDEQSLVRLLLYANELEIEGIIVNRAEARDGENLNTERTGLGIVRRLVAAYGEVYPSLVRHDPRYPDPQLLQQRTVSGLDDTNGAAELLIAAVDRADPAKRPLWYCDFGTDKGGAANNLKRALDQVHKQRGPEGYAAFKSRLRLSSVNQFGDHTDKIAPPFVVWVDALRPEQEGRRWYWRFSGITAKAGGFDLERDCRTGHGPLGALYPTNTTHTQKEGDTMLFLYLVPTGMNDPLHPDWGSWAGRYGKNPAYGERPYYWANAADAYEGTTHRENSLRRWAADLQNDFRARLDWCVQPPEKANHAPAAMVNGREGKEILYLDAKPGATLDLSAEGSRDPDAGQSLRYEWFIYPEAGTYRGTAKIEGAASAKAQLTIPPDAAGTTIHVILTLHDNGEPPLAAYRRVVVKCGPK